MSKIIKNILFTPAVGLVLLLSLTVYILKVLKNAILLKDISDVFNGIHRFMDRNHKESGFVAVTFCVVFWLFLILKLFTWLKG